MAINDALLLFCADAEIPRAVGVSLIGDVFDQAALGGAGGEGALRNLGSGGPLYVSVAVASIVTGGSGSKLEIRLPSGDDAALTTGVRDHGTTGEVEIGAGLNAGTRLALAFTPAEPFGRYVGLRAVVGGAPLAAGKLHAGVVLAVPEVTAYPAAGASADPAPPPPPPPAYTVEVEANGWVLAVTGDWPVTPGAWEFSGADRTEGRFLDGGVDQFPLDPNGTPKVTLTVLRQGFTRSGGEAVASSGDTEVLLATKALRKPYPNQSDLDEVDNGDGTRTVRLALSERLYAGDVVTACAFAAGWKAGEAGGAASVTNGSTQPLPVAISRFVQPHFQLVKGTTKFTAELLVAAQHPRHFGALANQAVAAVALYASDGTTTVGPFWATVGTSDRGDGLRCWRGEIDLTGLTAGPVSVFHSTYPWVGAKREQTRTHSTDTTNAIPTAWDAPLTICYDPDGTLYPHRHVYVDAATGSSDAATVTVATTLALAKAGTAAADVQTALAALFNANFTLPARNGWVADTARAADWCVLTLAAGVQAIGTADVAFGLNCNEGYLVIRGDPDDPAPKTNCILRTASAHGNKRIARLWFQDMAIEHGEANWASMPLAHCENVEVRGKAGYQTATTGYLFNNTTAAGYASYSWCRSTYWKRGQGVDAGNGKQRTLLARSCGLTRPSAAIIHVNCDKPDDGLFDRKAGTTVAFGGWNTSTSSMTDQIVWGNRALNWDGGGFDIASAKESGAGTSADPYVYRRAAVVNNLIEIVGPTNVGARMFRLGASPMQLLESVFDGSSFVGEGFNGFYDGGKDVGAPGTAVRLAHDRNAVRNNVFVRHAIKGDIFLSDGSLTGNWPHLYGVGYAANVHGNDTQLSSPSAFQYQFFGVGSLTNTDYAAVGPAWFGFTDPQYSAGSGGGDYTPTAGSPLLGRAVAANIDVDVFGATRGAVFPSGAVV